MVCLVFSTSVTTTVAALENWGTLKAGDKMQWQSEMYGIVTMEILSVEGKTISLELTEGGSTHNRTIHADESLSDANMWGVYPWLLCLEKTDQFDFKTKTYEFENTTYQAYYSKTENPYTGRFWEDWRDTNTGLLFEDRTTEADGTVTIDAKLISCTADLAEATGGGCLGTILIAMFSVSAVVSYSLVRYRKKKTHIKGM